jgi:hypothetical protein
VCGGGGGLFSEHADPAHGDDKGAGLQRRRRSTSRENLAGFGLCGTRRRVSELRQIAILETQILSRSAVGMARLVHDCGSREPEAAGIRVEFRFVCVAGLLGCRPDVWLDRA